MAVSPDMLAGHLQNWLARVGYPVRDFQMAPIFGTPMEGGAGASAALSTPGKIDFNKAYMPDIRSAAGRYGKRGKLNEKQLRGLKLLLHEGLHQMRYGRTPEDVYSSQEGRDWEEGATEAATQDLIPILAAQLYGHKMLGADTRMAYGDRPLYEPLTRHVRQMSVFGSKAKKYTDYEARVWRRKFHHADGASRRQMANQAHQARIEWGKRTGR